MIATLVSQLLALGMGCSACSVAEPIVAPSKTPAVLASVAAISDSACRVLDVTLDKSVAVEPAWFKDDSSYLDRSAGGWLKRVIMVAFDSNATQAERQAALDSVGGIVVGGVRLDASYGFYYIYVPSASTAQALLAAMDILDRQPKVTIAAPEGRVRPNSLKSIPRGRLRRRLRRLATTTRARCPSSPSPCPSSP